MVIGDVQSWAQRFRSLDTRILQCIVDVWPKCLAILPNQPYEDTITLNLINVLLKDPKSRRLFYWIEFHFEPSGYTSDGVAYSKGIIDMTVILDRDREKYLAYECKRLNVVWNGKKNTQATPYVTDGVIRFVEERYAENLPVGCMLGYVLDGDVSSACSKIQNAIVTNKNIIGFIAGSIQDISLDSVKRFSSRHLRSNSQEIEIRHALLSFGVPQKR